MLSTKTACLHITWWVRVDSWFAPSQWEMLLLCNDVGHWLSANLKFTLWVGAERANHTCLDWQIRKILVNISSSAGPNNTLTLYVRGPSNLGLARSISWLLMPWLLSLPGHQQLWYWLCRIARSLSYLRNNFNYLCHINVEEWHKM